MFHEFMYKTDLMLRVSFVVHYLNTTLVQMAANIHILNGDALLERFPRSLKGKQLVCRECLVEGPVSAIDLKTFYKTRKNYLNTRYGHEVKLDYTTHVKAVFDQMTTIPKNVEINLWFEDDLFCQVNLWFCLTLIAEHNPESMLFLVRPPLLTPIGFGGLNAEELKLCYHNRIRINKTKSFKNLWYSYQNKDLNKLIETAYGLKDDYSFVQEAVEAYRESLPSGTSLGRPKERLLQIITQLRTKNFGIIFQEFCKSEAIYGFGDLYVKHLYEELLHDKPRN